MDFNEKASNHFNNVVPGKWRVKINHKRKTSFWGNKRPQHHYLCDLMQLQIGKILGDYFRFAINAENLIYDINFPLNIMQTHLTARLPY